MCALLRNPSSLGRLTARATKLEWGEGGVPHSYGQKGRVTWRRGRAILDLHGSLVGFAKAGAKSWAPLIFCGPGPPISNGLTVVFILPSGPQHRAWPDDNQGNQEQPQDLDSGPKVTLLRCPLRPFPADN